MREYILRKLTELKRAKAEISPLFLIKADLEQEKILTAQIELLEDIINADKTMDPEIVTAYKKYSEAESKVPQYEYEKGYKSRNARARKLYREFSLLCEAEGLKPVQTAVDLSSKTLTF